MAVDQDVADLVAIQVAILVATLVATLVAILVVTLVATLQGVEEAPQLLLSSQALGLGLIMEGVPMEGGLHMDPTVLTPLGLLVPSVADNLSSTRIRLVCLALILASTFETLGKPRIGQLIRKCNTRTNKGTLFAISSPHGCVWIIAKSFHKLLAIKM